MELNNIEFRERIYNLANGFLSLGHASIPESAFVKDEFALGSPCAESYKRVLDAYERLCIRLASENGEDADVEIILNEMNAITKHISTKMFEYGVFFARREIQTRP